MANRLLAKESLADPVFLWEDRIAWGIGMTDNLDDGTARPAFVRALHASTAIADRIRKAIADDPPKLAMLALSDLLQEHLTRLVELDGEQTRKSAGIKRSGH